jgi:hypothetical protein
MRLPADPGLSHGAVDVICWGRLARRIKLKVTRQWVAEQGVAAQAGNST